MIEFDCSNIKSVRDITEQCKYTDDYPGGPYDGQYVSCCQDRKDGNTYNELEYFYNEMKDKYNNNLLLLRAMCECCKEKGEEKWKWDKYKICVITKYKVLAYTVLRNRIF